MRFVLIVPLSLAACCGLSLVAAAPGRAQSPPFNAEGNAPPGIPAQIASHQRASLTPSVTAAAEGGNEFAFDLFAELRVSRGATENALVSPFSISTALAMTYAGARGSTAGQMADALHFDSAPGEPHAGYGSWIADLNAPREGYALAVANRLFAAQELSFHQPFLDVTASAYGAPVERLDYRADPEAARGHINDWVEAVTHDRIQNLIPHGLITVDTRLVLTNAMYFKGSWASQFDESGTKDRPFHLNATESVLAPTMSQTAYLRIGQFDGYRMLEMPYAGDDLSMVFVVPDAVDGLAAVEAALTADAFQANVDALQHRRVAFTLPKFRIEDDVQLGNSLKSLGMTDAFSDAANFSGMSDESLMISEVVHKTFLEVDEQGTEAAAATAVIFVPTSLPPPPQPFAADRPFLFAIVDRHTDGLLFLGRMADPGGVPVAERVDVPEPSSLLLAWAAVMCAVRVRPRRDG